VGPGGNEARVRAPLLCLTCEKLLPRSPRSHAFALSCFRAVMLSQCHPEEGAGRPRDRTKRVRRQCGGQDPHPASALGIPIHHINVRGRPNDLLQAYSPLEAAETICRTTSFKLQKTCEEIMVARALLGVPVRQYIVMYPSGSFCVGRGRS
jgi:hypothetical protein